MHRAVAGVLLAFPISAVAMSLSYEVVFESGLRKDVAVVVRQYHSAGFDGERDAELVEDHLQRTDSGVIPAGGNETVVFDDAGGGFWVTWSAQYPDSDQILCEGEVDFTVGRSPYLVQLTPERCRGE